MSTPSQEKSSELNPISVRKVEEAERYVDSPVETIPKNVSRKIVEEFNKEAPLIEKHFNLGIDVNEREERTRHLRAVDPNPDQRI
jgi:hypothetical protein